MGGTPMGFIMFMSEQPYNPYNGIQKGDLILRDYLAIDRTVMANEVSFMSYIRTALTMVVAAMTFLKFFDIPEVHLLGWLFIVLAALLVIHGATRYEAMGSILNGLTGDIQNHPDASRRGPARRLLLATHSLFNLFR